MSAISAALGNRGRESSRPETREIDGRRMMPAFHWEGKSMAGAGLERKTTDFSKIVPHIASASVQPEAFKALRQ